MTEALRRLRAVNDKIETHFCSTDPSKKSSEEIWRALSPLIAAVSELRPVLDELRDKSTVNEDELSRYAGNLSRIKDQCTAEVAKLHCQQREIWMQEQSLRGQDAWRTY